MARPKASTIVRDAKAKAAATEGGGVKIRDSKSLVTEPKWWLVELFFSARKTAVEPSARFSPTKLVIQCFDSID